MTPNIEAYIGAAMCGAAGYFLGGWWGVVMVVGAEMVLTAVLHGAIW